MKRELLPLNIPDKQAAKIKLAVFDFDGVFTDNCVYISEDGSESVRCYRSDGLGLQRLRELGIDIWVLSTEPNPIVTRRCEKLKTPVIQNLKYKEIALKKLMDELNISSEYVAYTGNDVNDLGCLKIVSTPIVVQDAYPEAKQAATYITRKKGGYGAVREVCDWITYSKEYGKI